MRYLAVSTILFSIFLGGCVSSFQARQSPVIPMNDVLGMIRCDNALTPVAGVSDTGTASKSCYNQTTAIENFHAKNDDARRGLDRKSYRNMVISLYLSAIDSSYYNFITGVSTQNKSSDLFWGTAALGLSSAASVTGKKVANALSAGAAFATGTAANVNQKLYFDRTLPALLASMDANRNEAKTGIIKKMASSESDYPIEVAFSDLYDYQNSASLDSAIQRITVNAGQAAQQSSVQLKNARVDTDSKKEDYNTSLANGDMHDRGIPAVPASPVAPAAPANPKP